MHPSPASSPVDRTNRAGLLPAVELEAAIALGNYARALELAESGIEGSPESRDAVFVRELDAYNRILEAELAGVELQRFNREAWEVSSVADAEEAAREEHEAWQAVRCFLDADPRAFAPIDSRGLRESAPVVLDGRGIPDGLRSASPPTDHRTSPAPSRCSWSSPPCVAWRASSAALRVEVPTATLNLL